MSHQTQDNPSPSRLKFWLLRVVKTIVGGFLSGVLLGIATMFLRDAGLLSPDGQEVARILLTVSAWIAWLVYLIKPLFRRRQSKASA